MALAVEAPTGRRLVAAFLAGRRETTLRAYRQDLEGFRLFVGAETVEDAAEALLRLSHGGANEIALSYRNALVESLAPATVNRRLAALRSLVKVGRLVGAVAWDLEVENVKGETYRDTRGPGVDGFRAMVAKLAERRDAKGLRDRALLRVTWDNALRRAEVVGLDLEDVDLEGGRLAILGKGKSSKTWISLPPSSSEALRAWIAVRGTTDGPLFLNLDRAKKGGRLTARSWARIVGRTGELAGLGHVRAHGLRHASITAALDATGGNVRAVQRFSRHADMRTLQKYDDNRQDLAGEVARLVAAAG